MSRTCIAITWGDVAEDDSALLIGRTRVASLQARTTPTHIATPLEKTPKRQHAISKATFKVGSWVSGLGGNHRDIFRAHNSKGSYP